jgi:DNA-binding Lrp family transcriptional regulator
MDGSTFSAPLPETHAPISPAPSIQNATAAALPTASSSPAILPPLTRGALPRPVQKVCYNHEVKSIVQEVRMVTALVLLKVARDKVNSVAETLADMDGITEVYSVAGRYDLTVIIRVKDNDQLAELVTNHMLKVEGIQKSETLIAFRVYSRHDLESMFSIGL